MNLEVKRTTIVQFGLASVLAGLLLAKTGHPMLLGYFVIGLSLIPLLLKRSIISLLPIVLIGFSLGLWRGAQVYQQIQYYDDFRDQKITLIGTVQNDSAYSDRGQLEFLLGDITEQDTQISLPGTVNVRAVGVRSIQRGDVITATGKLREGFGARQGYMSYAQIEVVARDGSALEEIRSRYFAGVYSSLPEPQASLGLGFLVGTRTLLPESLLLALSVTGLTHIVAVSGYNLTILVRLTRRFFAKTSAYLSLASALALITGFVLVTGLSPSIARATVVSVLALLAWYYGRKISPTMLLLCSAAVTAMINPLYIWYDLGWYLSFSAFAGVLIIAPLVQKRFFKNKPKLLGQIVLETTCAQLMTLPIIALIFQEVSLISLLANVIVLPLIPLAMLTTFIAGLAGMLVPSIAGWLAWPAKIVLTFITEVVDLMSKVSWALQSVKINWIQLGLIYGIVLFIAFVLRQKLNKPLDGVEVIE